MKYENLLFSVNRCTLKWLSLSCIVQFLGNSLTSLVEICNVKISMKLFVFAFYCWNTDLSRHNQYFSFITYLYFYTCIWFDIQWEKTWRKVNQTWKKLSNHYFRIICNVKKGMRSKSEPKFEFILFLNIWVLYQRMWFMHNCLTITI